MERKFPWKQLLRIGSYILVAAAASVLTLTVIIPATGISPKLTELSALIGQKYIEQVDVAAMEDAAANAMVGALGDRWSYYIPAADMQAHNEQKSNEYVGIGATVVARDDELGVEVVQLEPGGSAVEAGMLPGDIICKVDGQPTGKLGVPETRNLIRGEAGTYVDVTILRNTQEISLRIERRIIQVTVAQAQMLADGVGYVRIANFDERCAEQTRQALDDLLEQGAQKLIFDVRFNPGGYKAELVKVLDYLLPEGPLFRSLNYKGEEYVDSSDEACLKLPMAVLVNGSSFSAAEFFAAALAEYDWATVVGEPTTGKGYFQNTYTLSDGSGVGLSVGKYFTPKGVSLEGVGIEPNILTEVDEATAAKIYAGLLPLQEDPQVLAALDSLDE